MIKYLVFERYLFDHLEQQGKDLQTARDLLSANSANRLERLRLLAGYTTRLCDDPWLGLKIGQQVSTMAYGILGQAIMHSATLVEAQKFVIKHLWMLHPSSNNPAHLEILTDVVQVRYIDPPFWPELPDFFIDLFFGAELKRARELTNNPISNALLELKREAPKNAYKISEILGIDVRFGAEFDQVSIPRAIAEAPLISSSITLSRAYREQCDAVLMGMQRSTSLAERIRQLIIFAPETDISISKIAIELGISERTLRRELAADGTSYRTIRNDVRCHLAQRYLIDTPLSVSNIAELLGYYDAATFSRAFVKWTGKTPRAYRLDAVDLHDLFVSQTA